MKITPKKRLIALMLIFSFGFTAPFYISSGAGAIAYISKEFGLDLIARQIARKALTDLSNGLINSINTLGQESGQPAPTFVQNWKKFLASAQAIGENQFRAQLDYTIRQNILCNDLKGPLALAFQARNVPPINIGAADKNAELKQNSLTHFQTKARCTVPDQTREEFKKDFAKGGGWETWSRLLEPQNNLAGATLLSVEELQKQRASQEEARKSEAVAGQGFQGVQGPCRDIGTNVLCAFLGEIITPSKILGEGAANFIDANANYLGTSDELSEVILSMIGAITKKLENFARQQALIGDDVSQPLDDETRDLLNKSKQDYLDFKRLDKEEESGDGGEEPTPTPEPTPEE